MLKNASIRSILWSWLGLCVILVLLSAAYDLVSPVKQARKAGAASIVRVATVPVAAVAAPAPGPVFPTPTASTVGKPAQSLRALEAGLDTPSSGLTTRLPVIEYHYTTSQMGYGVMMETEWFEAQMHWLADNDFTTLSLMEFVTFLEGTHLPPARSVVLTFDVGGSHFDDYLNVIIPTLRRYGLRAIFFVLVSQVRDTCDGQWTCWDSLIRWRDEGLISIESHSLYHIDYTTLTPAEIVLDAGRSRAVIEEKIGQPALGLCYPFDAINLAAFDLLKGLGYRFAMGGYTRAERSVLSADPDPYNLPRYYPYSSDELYPVISGTGGKTFEQMLWDAIAPP